VAIFRELRVGPRTGLRGFDESSGVWMHPALTSIPIKKGEREMTVRPLH